MNDYSYAKLLEDAKNSGIATESKIWSSIKHVAEHVEDAVNGKMDKNSYNQFLREQYQLFYGPHYNEEFARKDISEIKYTSKTGERKTGEYWSKSQIEDICRKFSFPSSTTFWDKYVAFNAFYSDMCQILDEETILKTAHKYFFQDEDAADGKIWKYMNAVRS